MNDLALVYKFNVISALNCQLLDAKKKVFSNKLLLLNFLRRGFGIDKDTLMEIQKSCPKSLKLIEDCRRNISVQKKNYKFVLKEGVLFAQFNESHLNKACIILPPYIAMLVLRHFHVEKKLHISPVTL